MDEQQLDVMIEKKHVIRLAIVGVLISLMLQLILAYRAFLPEALISRTFIRDVIHGCMWLVLLPYVIAYLLGRLLAFISWLVGDVKAHKTQYFVSWLLLILFSYFLTVEGYSKSKRLDAIVKECKASWSGDPKSGNAEQFKMHCSTHVLKVYPTLTHCMISTNQERRRDCVSKALKKNNILLQELKS